jgi:hypothetical protein
MPRPKLPKGERRDVPVYVLFKKKEAELLDIERRGTSRGGHLRKCFLIACHACRTTQSKKNL